VNDPAAPAFQPLGTGLRWLCVAFIAIGSIGFLIAIVGGIVIALTTAHGGSPSSDDLLVYWMLAFGILMFGLYGQMFVAPFWIYRAWSWLPHDQRYTKHWSSWVSPSQAAWFLVIPYFQYYWMFVINCGLCDALDRLRARYPTSALAPKPLAIAAGVCQLIIPFPVGMILWLVFMAKIEGITAEMSRS
jgi:hypothetical protein